MLVGDVKGKGLEAVALAAQVLTSFRAAAPYPSLVQLTVELDHSIRARLGEEEFVTAVLAQFGWHGELGLVNCGHPPPLRFRAETAELLASTPPTTPLGLDPAPTLRRFTLAPTDRVLLYTDGLVEARAPDGRQFELDGQVQAVVAASSLDAALDRLVSRLLEHVGVAWTTTWRWCWRSLACRWAGPPEPEVARWPMRGRPPHNYGRTVAPDHPFKGRAVVEVAERSMTAAAG